MRGPWTSQQHSASHHECTVRLFFLIFPTLLPEQPAMDTFQREAFAAPDYPGARRQYSSTALKRWSVGSDRDSGVPRKSCKKTPKFVALSNA